MAALSAVVSPNTAWQKVGKALLGAGPAAQEAFRALKIYIANQKLNPSLNVAFFTQADGIVAATGTLLGTGTPTIYAVYAKKGSVATSAWFHIADDATGDITGARVLSMNFTGASDEKFYMDPEGLLLANGICVHSTTTNVGTTSSTGATTAQDGFVIYSV
jgi:hypothetical protein